MSIQRLACKSVLFLGAPHIGTWWILELKKKSPGIWILMEEAGHLLCSN